MQIENELKELKQQYQQLEYDKTQSEQSLQAQIDQLKLQVQNYNSIKVELLFQLIDNLYFIYRYQFLWYCLYYIFTSICVFFLKWNY